MQKQTWMQIILSIHSSQGPNALPEIIRQNSIINSKVATKSKVVTDFLSEPSNCGTPCLNWSDTLYKSHQYKAAYFVALCNFDFWRFYVNKVDIIINIIIPTKKKYDLWEVQDTSVPLPDTQAQQCIAEVWETIHVAPLWAFMSCRYP